MAKTVSRGTQVSMGMVSVSLIVSAQFRKIKAAT